MADLETTVETPSGPTAALLSAVTAIRDKIDRDQFHAELVARLQAELEAYRLSAMDKLLLPIITGVVRLHADLSRMLDAVRREPPEKATPERLAKVVADFRSDLELLLDHGGVTLFVEVGDTFNPHRQVAQRLDPAPEQALVGKVAERLRQGFEYDGRVIEKERVAVFVAQAPTVG